MAREIQPATIALHTDYRPPAGFGSLTTPVYHASTVTFESVAAMRARDWQNKEGYTYGLHGTPTTYALEQQISEFEGGRNTLLVPSGLAAITLVDLAFLHAGDEVLLPANVYLPSRNLGASVLQRLGVTTRFYDPLIGAGIAGLISDKTRLIWVEAPGSVTMEMPDVPAIVAQAKARNVLVAIDNTWSGGLYFRPFDFGIDIAMHALTKYPSGGSDVLMGAVTTRDADVYAALHACHMQLGLGVSADDAYLVLRGMRSIVMRLAHHEKSALAVARWLLGRPEVASVLHPGLDGAPGHALWQRDFSGAGGLFSVVMRADISQQRVDAMVDALRLFQIGFSWGGAHSLAIPYLMETVRPGWTQGPLVRFYVGLESVDDLLADLEHGFQQLR